jgi:hypothetical protein
MSNEKKQSGIAKILTLDIRIVQIISIILMVIPLIMPFGLPIAIDPFTRSYYETIESLPTGSAVLFIADAVPSVWAEVGGQAIATLQHLIDSNCKIVVASVYQPESQTTFLSLVLTKVNQKDYEYGVDWVNFGYLEGKETAMSALAADFMYPGKDVYGNDVATLQLLEELKSIEDIDLVISVSPGTGQNLMLVRQFSIPHEKPMLSGAVASVIPDLVPYMSAGFTRGLLAGMPGAAQYELLRNKPGIAIKGMDAISSVFIWMMGFSIVTNIVYIILRRRGELR